MPTLEPFLEFDRGVGAVAERLVLRGAAATERDAVPHLVAVAVLGNHGDITGPSNPRPDPRPGRSTVEALARKPRPSHCPRRRAAPRGSRRSGARNPPAPSSGRSPAPGSRPGRWDRRSARRRTAPRRRSATGPVLRSASPARDRACGSPSRCRRSRPWHECRRNRVCGHYGRSGRVPRSSALGAGCPIPSGSTRPRHSRRSSPWQSAIRRRRDKDHPWSREFPAISTLPLTRRSGSAAPCVVHRAVISMNEFHPEFGALAH